MSRNPKKKSPIQNKGVYRIISEFLNTLDRESKTSGKNFLFEKNIALIYNIYSSKVFLFLKIKNQLILHQIIKQKNQTIRMVYISIRKNLILIISKKNKISLFHSNNSYKKKNSKSIKIFKFYKRLSFSIKNYKNGKIISADFDLGEDFFALSFQNGVVEILNLNAEIKMSFKLKNPLINISFQSEGFLKGKIFGFNNFFFLTEINLFSKKIKCFKNIKKIFNKKKYDIWLKNDETMVCCVCHHKKILNLKKKNYFAGKYFIVTDTKTLYIQKSFFFLINIFSQKKIYCTVYNSLMALRLESIVKNAETLINLKEKTNFWLRILYFSNKFQMFKPLSEKHKIFVDCRLHFSRLNSIYDVKFIGRKNFIALTFESNSIIIKTKKNFLYKTTFIQGNSIFLSIETKGAILVAINNCGKIFIWNFKNLRIICCFFAFLNIPGVFSFVKLKKSKGILLAGGKNGKIKNWEILFKKNEKLHIRFLKTLYSEKNKINSLTISLNGRIMALATSNKDLVLCNLPKIFPFAILKKFKRCFWCLNFSPKNRLLAAGSGNGEILLFEPFTGKCLDHLEGHYFPVLCCKFSQNGFFFFSSSSDGKIKIWKTNTGMCVNTITIHSSAVWNFDICSDCSFIISGCLDGKIILLKDSGFDLASAKIKNFKSFLTLQKSLNKSNFENIFSEILIKIISFYNTELLCDFFFYFFENFGKKFEKKLSESFRKLDIFNLKFLFHSLTVWSTKHVYSYMAQYILNLILHSYPFFLLNETSLVPLDNLILIIKNKLKKIRKIKENLNFCIG